MSLDALIMLSGAFVVALPFLGFPSSWDDVLLFIAGVFVIALGIVVRRRLWHVKRAAKRKKIESDIPQLNDDHAGL